MLEFLKRHFKNEKGLSLVELLAVIVILAIVAAIAIPSIGNIINNQRDKAVLAELSNAISTAKIAYVDGSCGNDGECVGTDIVFQGSKIDVTKVAGLKTTNPSITFAFKSGNTFEGTKFTVSNTVDENTLNSVMQNGVPAATPPGGGGN